MDVEKKVKLIYSGELIVIAVILLVIGILKLIGTIETKPTRLFVYNIITSVGAIWFIIDLIWTINSPKRRKSSSLLDKSLVMPACAYLMFFDIWCFVHKAQNLDVNDLLVKISIGSVLVYIGVVYAFLGLYHYKHPLPSLVEAIEEAKKENDKENSQEEKDETEPIENNENEDRP